MKTLIAAAVVLLAPFASADDWVALFDGKTLDGWQGDAAIWSVEDGEIVGRTTPETNRTTYLHRDGVFDDFELEFDIKLEGAGANSGMQYRSRRLGPEVGDGWDLAGYQADFDARHNYSGILYETRGRAIAATRGESKRFMVDGSTRDLAPPQTDDELGVTLNDDWHRYRIIADGQRLEHWINGTRVLLVEDAAPTRTASGSLALQVHAGDPMAVRMRDIRIRPLGSGSLKFADTDVPDAEPEWIWAAETSRDGEKCTLIRPFTLERPAAISIVATCDNAFRLLLDGTEVLAGSDWARTENWNGSVEAGEHMVRVHCTNEGGPAGFIAMILLRHEDGTVERILTGEGWLVESTDTRRFIRPMPVFSHGTISGHDGPWGNVMQSKRAEGTRTWSLPEGFDSELLVSAQPGQGSWVSCAFDPQGRLVICPQYGPIQVVDFDESGAVAGVRALPDESGEPIGYAQGLLHAHDALWINVSKGPDDGGGLWRLRDTDGDDVYDERTRVGVYGNGSEHGCHGVALAPDGSLWVVNGNYTQPPRGVSENSPFRGWAEDQLLERQWDPNGHAVGVSMPAGTVHRYDPATEEWTTVVGGFRNAYDLAFSPGGECFLYDSDMEWDIGTPWHIWPLVHHVVPGADYGWRGGNGKAPMWAPDRMRTVCATDESSPTGVAFGTNSSFPEPWRSRFFIGDWSYGRVLAVDLVPDGSTYTGTVHDFARGTPLNVTDFTIGPDGHMYLLTGGRRTQSGLYRIASDVQVPVGTTTRLAELEAETADLRAARHAMQAAPPVDFAVLRPALDSEDPALRLTARNAVRNAGALGYLGEVRGHDGRAVVEVLLAIAQEGEGPDVIATSWLDAFDRADEARRLELMRVLAVAIARGGEPSEANRERFLDALDPLLPNDEFQFDRQLVELLVALEAPELPGRVVDLLFSDPDPAHQLAHAMSIRNHPVDWDDVSVDGMMEWTSNASELHGGHSLRGFVNAAREDLAQSIDPNLLVGYRMNTGIAAIPVDPEAELGRMPEPVRAWTVAELVPRLGEVGGSRDLERGARVFRGTLCIQCHRFAGEGGSTGPDLTGVSGRYSREDMLRSLIEPSHSISDQYGQTAVNRSDGTRVVGRVVGMSEDEIEVNTNPYGRSIVTVPRGEVASMNIVETSAMPEHLLDVLEAEEILDLMAYLESGRSANEN